jgi:hypothetical protein
LPAERTDVRMTVFMKDAAAAVEDSEFIARRYVGEDILDPAISNTIVNGDVVVVLFDRLG